MAKSITQYDLLISCPGDAVGAVNIIKEVIDEFNQQFTDTLKIGIRCRYWKDSAFAESGGKPQDLLNKQIVFNSDLAVAVFKNRFGSPTDKYGSGTEEEIEEMLSKGRQVFVFFDESPVKMQDVDNSEYERVQAFKERYKDKGIFWTFSSEEEFKNIFRAHITKYFMTLSNEPEDEEQSNLFIRSYKSGKFEDSVQLLLFDMGGCISSERLKLKIIEQINQIKGINLIKSVIAEPTLKLFSEKKIEIENNTRDIIVAVAKILDVTIDEDFFDVGNLTESPSFSSLPFGGYHLNGTKEEKTKYNAIISLRKLIDETTGHLQMEEYYRDLHGVELVLCNDGTKYDEDIDVEITIPKNRYISVEELPVPTEALNLGEECSFADVFEIQPTKDFIGYSDSKRPLTGINTSRFTPVNPFSGRDYEEEYRDTLRDIFEYQLYPDGNNVILKVHFDYIKQHQSVAFPTWLFINNQDGELQINYRITTKNNRNIIERQIEIMSSQK